jgi:hypothetical protein
MFCQNLGEKCIIVQFLGMGKRRKLGVLTGTKEKIRGLNAETQRTQRKTEKNPGPPEGGPYAKPKTRAT